MLVTELSAAGKMSRVSKYLQVPGRIVSYKQDDDLNTGLLVLTDTLKESQVEFVASSGCQLCNFP